MAPPAPAESGGPPGYRALVESVGLILDSSRVSWRVDGERSLRALHGLLSADLLSPSVGSVVPSFVLSPRGRPLALLEVLKREDHVVLDIPGPAVAGLEDHFARYLPPRFARTTPLPGHHLLRVLGPLATDVVTSALQLGEAAPAVDRFVEVETTGGPVLAARFHPVAGAGWAVYAAGAALEAATDALERAAVGRGGGAAAREAFETWRVEHGIPRFGADITVDNLPQETGLVERTVSFEKGCYTGQEVVARIHYRGHVNRHLRGLSFVGASGDRAFAPGASLFDGDRTAGAVTSTADSPRFGPIGLGYVRRDVEPEALVALHPEGVAEIEVRNLPFTTT